MSAIGRLSALLWLVAAAHSAAATLQVSVVDAHGAPVSDAVVTLSQPGTTAARQAPATRSIDQRNETYIPYVETFRPGDRVVFSNSDVTRHHVYSFSTARAFEFVLVPGARSPPLVLEHAGVIAVGCNIHDHMLAYLYVTDAPFLARTEQGRAEIGNLASGEYSVKVWHPQQRHEAPVQVARLAGGAAAQVSFALSLLPDPRVSDRERSGY
jgi:plastocyanin